MVMSAFIVKVSEAESLVGSLRERFDATFRLGVPAHITVLVPFMDPSDITVDVLDRAQRALVQIEAFSFVLRSVHRFPETAYLAPEPAAPFIAMTQALVAAFPEFRPYGGAHEGVIPHLTVATGSAAEADEAANILQCLLEQGASVTARCASISLIENASGRWRELHAFPLSQATSATQHGSAR